MLRPYQQHAIDQLLAWFGRNASGNPVVSASVGAGKSHMIAALVQYAMSFGSQRVLMLVQSKELCEQNAAKLLQAWPDAPIGILSASMGKHDTEHPIIFATIGTAHGKDRHLGWRDLVLVDECHNINTRDSGMYRTLIGKLKAINPKLRIVGWTGTPFRGNGVWITDGESPLFDDIAATIPMRELLKDRYLAPLRLIDTQRLIDASKARVQGGDYVVKDLAEIADDAAITEEAVSTVVQTGKAYGRHSWVTYCTTVAHAEHVRDCYRAHGVVCDMVTAETPAKERALILKKFAAGHITSLVNVAVLTTGWDCPRTDLIALLRPTQSPVLYVQIAGRGMRTCEGKSDCLWLDFTDTTSRLGPVDAVKGKPHKVSDPGEAPFKLCHECGAKNTPKATQCIACGADLPVEHQSKLSVAPSNAAILTNKERVEISEVRYSEHYKPGKPTSLRVDYYAGMNRICSEWVCFEHEGFARRKAEQWFEKRAPISPNTGQTLMPPGSVSQLLEWIESGLRLAKPTALQLLMQKYPEILGYEFEEELIA